MSDNFFDDTPAADAQGIHETSADGSMEGIEFDAILAETGGGQPQEYQQQPVPGGQNGSATATQTQEGEGTAVSEELGQQAEGDDDLFGEIVVKKWTYVDYLKSPIVTLQVGTPPTETTLSAHLALLQTSPWFAESCASYSASTPTAERLIILPDEDLQAVGAFLEFLYTNEYTPRLVPSSSGRPEDMVLEGAGDADIDDGGDHLLKHARVYTLAEKLQLPDLKHLAHSKIHRINSTAKGELRYAMFVYQNTSREDKIIRQPIASFWAHRSHVLRHEAEEEFRRMVLEFPEFAYDILSIVLDQKEKGKDREHHKKTITQRPSTPGGDDADNPPSAHKALRSNRKRPRVGTVL